MRRYPAYRESGVDWLGEAPEGWKLSPLKHVADFDNGAAFKPTTWSEQGTPIIRIENLNGGTEFNCYDGEMPQRYHVREGDILFGWSGNIGTSFGPFIWPRSGRYYLNQHIFNVRNFECDRVWLYWCLRVVTHYVERKAHGIIGMVHITKGDLGEINIPLPSPQEQRAIATFLDRETAKIDTLVAEQRRLIALLAEKRQAVISHAVTRGLNPDARLKLSGIDWLGDVPEGWEVVPLRRALVSTDYGISDSLGVDGPVAVLRMGNILEGRVRFDDLKYADSVPSELLLESGDLLFNRTNSLDLIGKVGLFDGGVHPQVSFASYLVRLRLKAGFSPLFFSFLLNANGMLVACPHWVARFKSNA